MSAPLSGEIWASDEIAQLYLGYRFGETVPFTVSGTFEKADYDGLRAVRVRLVGGGGPGGNAVATGGSQYSGGGGGEGGCYAEAWLDVSLLDTSETVTVGAAGTTAGATDAASTSSFGALVVGPGGQGGSALTAAGTIGVANGGSSNQLATAVGDLIIPGMEGGRCLRNATSWVQGGVGGNSILGHGGIMKFVVAGTAAASSGRGYGAGGGGALNGPSQSATGAGGATAGIVLVDVYF